MKKACIPIVSCSPKYLGLTMFEYAINGFFLLLFLPVLEFLEALRWIWAVVGFQVFAMYVYVKYVSKLEENIIEVFLHNFKIPNVIWGYFNSLPKRVIRNDNIEAVSTPED